MSSWVRFSTPTFAALALAALNFAFGSGLRALVLASAFGGGGSTAPVRAFFLAVAQRGEGRHWSRGSRGVLACASVDLP